MNDLYDSKAVEERRREALANQGAFIQAIHRATNILKYKMTIDDSEGAISTINLNNRIETKLTHKQKIKIEIELEGANCRMPQD